AAARLPDGARPAPAPGCAPRRRWAPEGAGDPGERRTLAVDMAGHNTATGPGAVACSRAVWGERLQPGRQPPDALPCRREGVGSIRIRPCLRPGPMPSASPPWSTSPTGIADISIGN